MTATPGHDLCCVLKRSGHLHGRVQNTLGGDNGFKTAFDFEIGSDPTKGSVSFFF